MHAARFVGNRDHTGFEIQFATIVLYCARLTGANIQISERRITRHSRRSRNHRLSRDPLSFLNLRAVHSLGGQQEFTHLEKSLTSARIESVVARPLPDRAFVQ